MAKNDKVRMPSSGAGLTQYYDTKSAIQLKPAHVILLIIIVIAIEALLYTQGAAILGLN